MRKNIILITLLLAIGVMATICGTVFAYTMQSNNYRMEIDSVNIGGGESSSALYSQQSTIGEVGTGLLTNSSTKLYAGFQQPSGCNYNLVCEGQKGEDILNCKFDCDVSTPFSPQYSSSVAVPTVINNVQVKNISFDSALISWQTSDLANCKIYFGTTSDYFSGFLTEGIFLKDHTASIVNLYSATFYHFKIICRDTNENWSETGDYQFLTLPISESEEETLPNIENLNYQPSENQIDLSWKNPRQGNWKEIQIYRSEDFYPKTPKEGELVYKGNDNFFADKNTQDGKDYYYTAFTVDENGSYSSGAILKARLLRPGETGVEIPPAGEVTATSVPAEIEQLTWRDFEFWQNGKRIEFSEGKFSFEKDFPIKVAIAYKKVPEVLKTMMVSLKRDDRYFSFLLKINKGKTHYIATMAPPEEGLYPMSVYILDYENQTVKKMDGLFEVKSKKAYASFMGIGFLGQCKSIYCFVWFLIPLAIIILALTLLIILLKRKNKKQPQKNKIPINASGYYRSRK